MYEIGYLYTYIIYLTKLYSHTNIRFTRTILALFKEYLGEDSYSVQIPHKMKESSTQGHLLWKIINCKRGTVLPASLIITIISEVIHMT